MNAIQYVVQWGWGGGGDGVLLVMWLDSRCVRYENNSPGVSYAVSRWPNTELYGTMIVRIGRGEAETKYEQSESHIILY